MPRLEESHGRWLGAIATLCARGIATSWGETEIGLIGQREVGTVQAIYGSSVGKRHLGLNAQKSLQSKWEGDEILLPRPQLPPFRSWSECQPIECEEVQASTVL
jgi:hypothetical protein